MRVVSLVPSATETLVALGVAPVGCTRFCEQPSIPTYGGTKDPAVESIIDLAPDLVVVNDEENRRQDAARLVDAGLRVHSMSPRTVGDVGPAVRALADTCSVAIPEGFGRRDWAGWLERAAALRPPARSVCTLVWRRPWLVAGPATYGSSVLDLLGLVNVIDAADAPRYPEVSLDEIERLGPDLVVLPSEPYPFSSRHLAELRASLPDARLALVDGRDLFWWGIRTPAALGRLRATLEATSG